MVQLSKLEDYILDISHLLNCERVNIWKYNVNDECLDNIISYQDNTKIFIRDVALYKSDFPFYFLQLLKEDVLITSNAPEANYLKELKDSYVIPLGIISMIDVVLKENNNIKYLICFEHTKVHQWTKKEVELCKSAALQIQKLIG